jgi:hypothetical protein
MLLEFLAGRPRHTSFGAPLAGAYVHTRPGLEAPDLHLQLLLFSPCDEGWDLAKCSGCRLGMYQNRLRSRGRVRITPR